MLPDAYDSPALVHKLLVLSSVPRDVRVKLGRPPWPVVLRLGPVLGATMPEAAIHEDRQTNPGEDDVRSADNSRVVRPKPEPPTVQLPT